MKKIIYTDLDGTLLDFENYTFDKAIFTLKKLKKRNIPVVICTSKTRAEIEFWRKKISNSHPFISENGGGIFIPKCYFDFNFDYDTEDEHYNIIILGEKISKLTETLEKIKKEFEVNSFIDMNIYEIAKDANLSLEEAQRAKKREFDIPFKVKNLNSEEKIYRKIREHKLKYIKGGRYYHLMGNNNKGKAVKILTKLYKKQFGEIFTIGIGDSVNDFSMLNSVDRGYLVMKKNEKYASSDYNPAGGIGPAGWKKVIEKELKL